MRTPSARRARVECRMVAEITGATRSPVKQKRNPSCVIFLGSSAIFTKGRCPLPMGRSSFLHGLGNLNFERSLSPNLCDVLATTNGSRLHHRLLLSKGSPLAGQDLNEIAGVMKSVGPFRPLDRLVVQRQCSSVPLRFRMQSRQVTKILCDGECLALFLTHLATLTSSASSTARTNALFVGLCWCRYGSRKSAGPKT
jgi:hypothetical protein